MKFLATELDGVIEIETEPHLDERGSFARLFCPDEFERAGLSFSSTQLNLSQNTRRHTLRGMHFQRPPFAEAKVVRAFTGAIYDVVVDVRPASASRGRWISRVLEARRGNALFIPEGFAHGFMTLADDTDVFYQMGRSHAPGQARGFRYDDAVPAISWPAAPQVISDADRSWPAFDAV